MGTEKHFIGGSFYRVCDRTGFATRSWRTRKQWNNLIVRNDVWEIRQPQDFVRGTVDDQNVPEPRPRSVQAYDGPLHTFITEAASIGDIRITVQETARMYPGDELDIVLDNGNILRTMILKVQDSTHLLINDKLPSAVSVNNDVTNVSAVSPPNPGQNAFGQQE